MKKLLDKENINASDCKNALRWASAYCYSDSIHHISYAEEFAKKTLEKASEAKQTKPLIEALIRLNDFIELPKGIADKEKARLMQQPLIELEEVVELLEHAPDFSSYEIYVRILEVSKRVIDMPPYYCPLARLKEVMEVLRTARLNVAALSDSSRVDELSKELLSQLRDLNERVKGV